MDGRGIDLSGGSPSVDLSGGGSGAAVNLSGAASPPAAAAPASASDAPGAAAPGGYAGQMGANMATAALQNTQVQEALKAQASEAANQGWEAAKVGGYQAATELHKYVQEGPAGISILCFLGGCATCAFGLIGMLNLGNIFAAPFQYVLSCYLSAFGLVSMLLEADVEKLAGRAVVGKLVPLCEHYQMEIFERAKFLTELRGRGFFYLFVGTLAITQCLVCLYFLCGLWNVLMGVLCLMMSFGINPADHLPASAADSFAHHTGQPYDQQQAPLNQQGNYGQVNFGP